MTLDAVKCCPWVFHFGEHLNKKRGKLMLLPVAGGCHVHKESLPMRNRCRHLKNFWGSFPSAKACNVPFPDCWSGLLWANNRATQEVSASEVKAWKENLQSYLRWSFSVTLSSVSHLERQLCSRWRRRGPGRWDAAATTIWTPSAPSCCRALRASFTCKVNQVLHVP